MNYEELKARKIQLEGNINACQTLIEKYNKEMLIYDSQEMKDKLNAAIAREEGHVNEYTIELEEIKQQLIPYEEKQKNDEKDSFEAELEGITDFEKLNKMAEDYRMEADRIEAKLDSGDLSPDKYIKLQEKMEEYRRRSKLCNRKVFSLEDNNKNEEIDSIEEKSVDEDAKKTIELEIAGDEVKYATEAEIEDDAKKTIENERTDDDGEKTELSEEELKAKKSQLEGNIKECQTLIEKYNKEILIYDSQEMKDKLNAAIAREEDHVTEYSIALEEVKQQLIPYEEKQKNAEKQSFEAELAGITDFEQLNKMAEDYRMEADRIEAKLDDGDLSPDKYIKLQEKMEEYRRRAKLCSKKVFSLDDKETEGIDTIEEISTDEEGKKTESVEGMEFKESLSPEKMKKLQELLKENGNKSFSLDDKFIEEFVEVANDPKTLSTIPETQNAVKSAVNDKDRDNKDRDNNEI